MNERTGMWVVFGDFNVVRNPSERCNSQLCPSSAFAFIRFVHGANLKDLNMGGEKFTFMSRIDAKLSKLDRFLVCLDYLSSFSLSVVMAHPRELSDHSPITLISATADFGPIPFKNFNSWLLREGFDQVVIDSWNNFRGYGTPDAYLAAKLRFLKESIKKWIRDVEQEEKKMYNDNMVLIKDFEKLVMSTPLSPAEVEGWNSGIKKISKWERFKVLDLKHKARIKWTVDGDENNKFFHGYINCKNRRNLLHGLKINGRLTTEVNAIKGEVFRFFHDKFTEVHVSRPKLINLHFKSISMMDATRIESSFCIEEVKFAIWDCRR